MDGRCKRSIPSKRDFRRGEKVCAGAEWVKCQAKRQSSPSLVGSECFVLLGQPCPHWSNQTPPKFSFCCSERNTQSRMTQTKNTKEVTKKFSMKNTIFFHALHVEHVHQSLTPLSETLGLIKGINLWYKADPLGLIIMINNGTCRTLSGHTQI